MKSKIGNLDLWIKFKTCIDKNERIMLKNKLILIYYPFVKKISHKVAKKIEYNLSPEELASFGLDGLYDAIENYDLSRNIDFHKFSYLRISGSMIDNIRKNDFVSRTVRQNQSKIEKAKDSLLSEKGYNVKESEILEKAGIDKNEYTTNTKKYKTFNVYSLDGSDFCNNSYSDDFQKDLNDVFIDNNSKNPNDAVLYTEFLHKLIGKNFSQLEQKIVYLYYYKNYTMEEIAEKVKMSESRVSQIHKEVLPRLKDKILRNPNYFEEILNKID